jgi:hypothetical protein
MKKLVLFPLILILNAVCINGKNTPSAEYIALEPDINQYYQYANGGWDGNWYVGHNSCWIVKLPPISTRNYKKAFIGAKLGRAKTARNSGDKPWMSIPLEGKIFMALAQKAGFTSRDSYMLVENPDIPVESPKNESSVMAGHSQWFWVEVPLNKISAYKPNFLALWSNANEFISSDNSPIVAGANTNGMGLSAWLNRSGKGAPPRDASKALEIPLKGIAPALAVKLVPKNNLKVEIHNFEVEYTKHGLFVSFDAGGQDIYRGWIEISHDRFHWSKLSRFIFGPPYMITLYKENLPEGVFYIRTAAADTLENTAYSKEKEIRLR